MTATLQFYCRKRIQANFKVCHSSYEIIINLNLFRFFKQKKKNWFESIFNEDI